MTTSINFSKTLAVFAVALACMAPAAFAHAADLTLDGYGGSYADSAYYTIPSYDYGGSYADTAYYTTPDYGSYDYGGSYADSAYYTTPASYDYGYGTPVSYFGGGGGFMGGGFIGGGGFVGGGGFSSVYAPTNTYAPTTVTDNGNTYAPTYAPTSVCDAPNSCNSTVDDHSIVNAPTTVTVSGGSGGSYPVYQPVVYTQPPVYTPPPVYVPPYQPAPVYPQPVARAPYVTLSAVPYTGLDLGPVGTALYWSFLVLWCLAAAYLVVVKRVQTKVVSKLNTFLFGSTALTAGSAAKANVSHEQAPEAETRKAPEGPAVEEDGIDPFIASQIAR